MRTRSVSKGCLLKPSRTRPPWLPRSTLANDAACGGSRGGGRRAEESLAAFKTTQMPRPQGLLVLSRSGGKGAGGPPPPPPSRAPAPPPGKSPCAGFRRAESPRRRLPCAAQGRRRTFPAGCPTATGWCSCGGRQSAAREGCPGWCPGRRRDGLGVHPSRLASPFSKHSLHAQPPSRPRRREPPAVPLAQPAHARICLQASTELHFSIDQRSQHPPARPAPTCKPSR